MAERRLFVSHSHYDNDIGLRLITDLRSRLGNDAIWFDVSGGLQGGDEWWRTIVQEILARDYFLVILSQEALASPWVRKEMELAFSQHVSRGKRLLPLLYHPCESPSDWQLIQMIPITDPEQDADAYERGLMEVLRGVGAYQLTPPAPPTNSLFNQKKLYSLYKQGLEARNRKQWTECADCWREILADDPVYLGGSLAADMQEIEREVATLEAAQNILRLQQAVKQAKAGGQLPVIVQGLYALILADPTDNTARQDLWESGMVKANAERERGAWNDEIASWELLLRVLPDDKYANRRKAIAEQNQQYIHMYRVAYDLTKEGKKADAAAQLTKLWNHAPYYGDPFHIASSLALSVPPTYDEKQRLAKEERLREQEQLTKEKRLVKERQLAEEMMAEEMRRAEEIRLTKEKAAANTRHDLRAKLLWDYQGRIDREVDPNKRIIETVSRLMETWKTGPANNSDHSILNTLVSEREAIKPLESNVSALLNQFILYAQNYLLAWSAQEAEESRSTLDRYRSDDGWPQLVVTYLILASVLFVSCTLIYGAAHTFIDGLIVGSFMAVLSGIPLALVLSRLVSEPLSQHFHSIRDKQIISRTSRDALICRRTAVTAGDQLLAVSREMYQAHSQQIATEQGKDAAAVEGQYQRRMAEIAAEHVQALANIRAKYV